MKPQRKWTIVWLLGMALLVSGLAGLALAAGTHYQITGWSPGKRVKGTFNSQQKTFWAGVIKMKELDSGGNPTGSDIPVFCTDLAHTTHKGVEYEISNLTMDCRILYILNKYPPSEPGLTNAEAAARQAAVWYYSDGFVIDPGDPVASRVQAIISEVEGITNNGANPELACQAITPNVPDLFIQKIGGVYTLSLSPDDPPPGGLEVTVTYSLNGGGTSQEVVILTGGPQTLNVPNNAAGLHAEGSYPVPRQLGVILTSIESNRQKMVMAQDGFVPVSTDFEVPTAVTLASFRAQVSGSEVSLRWETGAEVDNAGFNLYRAPSALGPWTRLNPALIAAQGSAVSGAVYTFTDTPGSG
ncbi:MAG: hypothetical protein D6796_13350, partial [Caldilineae bacterium]